tara:strand:+ start:299 stop:892 length:594 start_codon:yes stop_codon:yes gene_type:complete
MIALFSISIYLRIILELFGQNWIKTLSHTATLLFLPVITYVITSIISGNIALSLGMVGALSIVRFRNPVRSPLELTVYFAAITIGIAAAADVKWILFLGIASTFICIILYLTSTYYKRVLKKNFFIASFSEGNSLSTLEVKVIKSISLLDESEFLKSKILTQNNYSYLLASNDFKYLKRIATNLEKDTNVISYELNQ